MSYDKARSMPLLTAEQELSATRDELILCNTRLVASRVKRFEGRGVDSEDLEQEGMIGLIKAADKFDPAGGTRFSTLATMWIDGEMRLGSKPLLRRAIPYLRSRGGLGTVLGDLAALGFDAEWGVLGAHHSGAPHKRDRIWILARNSDFDSEPTQSVDDEAPRVPSLDVSDTFSDRGRADASAISRTSAECASVFSEDRAAHSGHSSEVRGPMADADACSPGWWATEPNVGRVAHGLAARVDRLRCIGNGQVPAVAALAWKTLTERLSG